MNLWFRQRDFQLCLPPKCGGTALYRYALGVSPLVEDRAVFSEAIKLREFISVPEAKQFEGQSFIGFRDPVARFRSLWRDKCRNGDDNLPELKGLSPTDLLYYVAERLYDDPHWAPQATYYFKRCVKLPYVQILDWFGVDRYVNATERLDDPPMPVSQILLTYRTDVRTFFT